jgi:hypothetical protein
MDPKPLNRVQLAKICNNDPEAIRLLERLFQVSGSVLPDGLAELSLRMDGVEDAVNDIENEVDALQALIVPTYVGSGVLDFGSSPGDSVASLTVTGQENIVSGSVIRVWLQGETADHSEFMHSRILPGRIGLGIADIVAGVGFTIFAETEIGLTGQVAVKWEWR